MGWWLYECFGSAVSALQLAAGPYEDRRNRSASLLADCGLISDTVWCGTVYLRTRPETVLERIHQRGRKEELTVPLVSSTVDRVMLFFFSCDFSCFFYICFDTIAG